MGAAAGERPWPGATAIVLLLTGGRVYAANAGDCRAVLCSQVRLVPVYWSWLAVALRGWSGAARAMLQSNCTVCVVNCNRGACKRG